MGPETVTLTSIVTQREGLFTATLGDRVVMLGLEQGRYYRLNPTGTCVWLMLGAPMRVSAVCDAVEREFIVTRELCEKDVLTLIAQLVRERLVRVCACES